MPQITGQNFRCWRPNFATPSMTDADGSAVVNALYRLVLGRDADPSGMGSFRPNLVYGRSKQQDIEFALIRSAEYCARRVTIAYQDYLKRSPEPGATDAHCAPYVRGTTSIESIISNIQNSAEAWVQVAFTQCNAGSPSAAQMCYWQDFFLQSKDGSTLVTAVCQATPPGAIPPQPPIKNSVVAGTRFNIGDKLDAGGACGFWAVMQSDGNFVIYRGNTPHWWTGSNGNPGATAIFQGDGNFVVYRTNNSVAYNAGTNGRGAVTLILQTDGNLVMLNGAGAPVWSIGKAVPGCF